MFGSEAQAFFSKHVNVNRPLTVTSSMRQTLGRDGRLIDQDWRQQNMVSCDLLYFVLRACFDGVKSDYCQLPEKVSGEGEASYQYGHKVLDVKDVGKWE